MSLQVIIIGAGPAGLTAAICAAREGARVLVLEGMKKPGRKLLLTGNGRCNLTHMDADMASAYHSSHEEACRALCRSLFERYPAEETLRFFSEIGLACYEREGYVYPLSGQAASVLNVLLAELKRLQVRLKLDAKVKSLRFDRKAGKWQAGLEGWTYEADRVILCCGSKAAPATGSDGSGYALARELGHEIVPVFPALTAMTSPDPDLKLCAGARTRAQVTLFADDTPVGTETGEVQWNRNEVSGIAVFQLSRHLHGLALPDNGRRRRGAGPQFSLCLDFVPGIDGDSLAAALKRRLENYRGCCSLAQLLGGYVPDRTAEFLLRRAGCQEKDWKKGNEDKLAGLLSAVLKETRIPVTGTRAFEQAQVCGGGIALHQVDPETLQSLVFPGLYFAGEILDIDGPCGGYNLQWAWSSGMLAGKSAAKDEIKEQ